MSRYLRAQLARGPTRLRLFAFAHAGGSSAVFKGWSDALPPWLEVIAAELPGHGTRFLERPIADLGRLADGIAEEVLDLEPLPYVAYGHSMGGWLAIETAYRLRRRGYTEPSHLLIGASRAPGSAPLSPRLSDLDDAEFVRALRKLRGTPSAVIEDAELMALLVPSIRADFEAYETHTFADERPLGCPLTVYGGLLDDGVPESSLAGWRSRTAGRFRLCLVPGDHFFISTARDRFLAMLSVELERIGRPQTSGGAPGEGERWTTSSTPTSAAR